MPLYFVALRRAGERSSTVNTGEAGHRPISEDDVVEDKQVRFRTLGCYPLTGAVESGAESGPARRRTLGMIFTGIVLTGGWGC